MEREWLNKILVGDALEQLRALPDESVHCCITSPPYWGLRDYQTGTWEGGDAGCKHQGKNVRPDHSGIAITGRGHQAGAIARASPYKSVCGACGATRIDMQIGLEETPGEYVGRLVEVFGEVRRVLRKDGVLWLNLGDSYASSAKGSGDSDSSST